VFDFWFVVIICDLDLLCLIYVCIVVYGYFGCMDDEGGFMWECINWVEFLCAVVFV